MPHATSSTFSPTRPYFLKDSARAEPDSALGDERFAEQDSAGASDEPLDCLPTLFDRALYPRG
jgi:hypothetical protein